MNIKWVPTKKINTSMVNTLLQNSINTNQFANYGPNVQELEKYIKYIFGIIDKSAICVCNATAGLHALTAGIQYYNKRNVRWITQSFTFPPSAQGFLRDVEIVDIDQQGGLDLNQVTRDTDGIIVTNIFGNVVDIDKYVKWSQYYEKFLIFDSAATPMTTYNGLNSLNYGTGSVISFHHTKPLGFGEGGAIIVDSKYEPAIRKMLNFGIDENSPWDRLGANYKMSDISAVYILQYLYNYTEILNHHKKLYRQLSTHLPIGVRLFPNFGDEPFVSCFCLVFDQYDDTIHQKFLANGIYCRKYYKPLIQSPVAVKYYENILCLPCTIDMTIEDINSIIDILRKLF